MEYEHTGDTLHPTTTSIEYIVLKCTSDVFPGLAGSPVIQMNQGMYVAYLKSYESVRKHNECISFNKWSTIHWATTKVSIKYKTCCNLGNVIFVDTFYPSKLNTLNILAVLQIKISTE